MLLKHNLIIASIALSGSILSFSSLAATATNTTKATASLNKTCLLSSVDINFGSMDLISGENDANGSINVLCSKGTTYGITMAFGHVEAQQVQAGNMIGQVSSDIITYGINSSYHSGFMWGKDVAVNGTGNGSLQTFITYGRAYTGLYSHSKYPTPDNYSDTVSVTLTY